ncbi:MAG TPA: acyltransferase family protein [Friedmanniella sp.]
MAVTVTTGTRPGAPTAVAGALEAGSTARPHKKSSTHYRPEIEGTRAVASLLVATFHIWLGRVSGGVDVFFVIAGFLTTVTLLGHVRRFGRIRPVLFASRLASRLFPAAATVLIVVTGLSLALLEPFRWIQTLTESLSSALYLENWQLYRAGIDYLTQDKFHSPVQNFWAMSVQGQFYGLWALVFLGLALVVRVTGTRRARVVLVVTLTGLVVLSFGYALVAVRADQASAYYDTFARVWEFGLGGLAAVLLPGRVLDRRLRWVAGWLGLVGLLTCGFVLHVSTEFPGVAALWPTSAAVLVLVAGCGAPARLGAERLLSSPALVRLGGLSYGLYLWHWPLLVLYRQSTDQRPSIPAGLAIIGTSLGLAWLTRRFVEDPLHRRGPRARALVPLAVLVVAALVAGLSLTLVTHASTQDQRLAHQRATAGAACFGAAALASWPSCSSTAAWTTSVPAIDAADDGSAIDEDRCLTDTVGVALKECVFGVRGAGTRVALIGNSHAASLFPAFERVARQRGWELHTFYKTGCVWNQASRREDTQAARTSCHRWVDELQARLAAQPAYAYVLTGYSARKSVYVDARGAVDEQAGIDGFRTAWQPMIARGTQVLALRDNPVIPDIDRLSCEQRPGTTRSCAVSEAEGLPARDLSVAAATGWPGATAIDLQAYYCLDGRCPLVIGGVKVYRDLGHLTQTYALTLTPYLDAAITRATGRP